MALPPIDDITGDSSGICLKTLAKLAYNVRKRQPESEDETEAYEPVATHFALTEQTFRDLMENDEQVGKSFRMGWAEALREEREDLSRRSQAGDIEATKKLLCFLGALSS